MNETITANINQNYAECIKSVTHWGSTAYTNICTGQTYSLPWGFMDYAGVGLLGLFALLLLVGIVFLVAFIIMEVFG